MAQVKGRARTKADGDYHHGGLREALLAAALAMIDEQGPAAVSTREVARRLRVSHAAPARHFPDRATLLAEVAARAFEGFARALEEGAAGAANPRAALAGMGRAYVRFAIEHPGQVRLMFGPDLSQADVAPQHLLAASAHAYTVLEAAVRRVLGARASSEKVEAASFLAWAEVHGAATLWLDGPFRRGQPVRGAESAFLRLADAAVEAVTRTIAQM